jgi:hypothetical protein
MDGYVTKPVNSAELYRAIEKLLAGAPARQPRIRARPRWCEDDPKTSTNHGPDPAAPQATPPTFNAFGFCFRDLRGCFMTTDR